ncbi:MAG: hypothetical protein R6W75_07730, partial [Smithellaceae bacterium]
PNLPDLLRVHPRTAQTGNRHTFWPTKNLSYPQPRLYFLPSKAKTDDHCRLEAIDSSFAVVSIFLSENIFF